MRPATMHAPGSVLQKAVVARLADLEAGGIKVYAPVAPPEAAPPFVTVGQITGNPDTTKTTLGFDCSLTINIWSDDGESLVEANEILDTVLASLSREPLDLGPMFEERYSTFESFEFVPELIEEEIFQRGQLRYRWRIAQVT